MTDFVWFDASKYCGWCGDPHDVCRCDEVARSAKRDLFLTRVFGPRLIVELIEGDEDYLGCDIS